MSFKISIFGQKITSPTQNDDRDGKFVFQKLVSDDLKWSEMPKKHENRILKLICFLGISDHLKSGLHAPDTRQCKSF